MQAWQFVTENAPLTLNDVPEPEPGAGEVVIDVAAAGMCHSDIGILDGALSHTLTARPRTLGHEIAGTVSAVGEGVTGVAPGDRVVVSAQIDGPGGGYDGGYAARVLAPAKYVVALPVGIAWAQAAAATDAGATSYHAVVTVAGAGPGVKVGIIGFGGLGSLATQIALAVGAEVHVAEINEAVHEFVREFPVEGVSTSIRAFTDAALDVVIDLAGFGVTTDDAIAAVRPGGRIVQVGLGNTHGTLDLQALVLKQLTLVGSLGSTVEDCAAVLDLVGDGKVVSRVELTDFDGIPDALERLRNGEVIGRAVALLTD